MQCGCIPFLHLLCQAKQAKFLSSLFMNYAFVDVVLYIRHDVYSP